MTEMTLQHRLQEVSDLLLRIYQTLSEMGYLDPSWIIPGLHKLDERLLTKYESLNLDPAIIQLFSLLPYVDNHDIEPIDFFQGGEFFDARDENHLDYSRDPMYLGVSLPPWRTILSRMGNHMSVMFYDARRNMIAIQDHESSYSTDHVIRAWEGRQREMYRGRDGGDPNPYALMDETDEEVITASEENGGHGYGGMMWRSAPDVLRDMLSWYENLVETPGGGEQSHSQWDHEDIVPIYKAAGWPDRAKFDREKFLVAKARSEAARKAKYHAEEPLRKLSSVEGGMGPGRAQEDFELRMERARGDVEEEWHARWMLWIDLKVQETRSKQVDEVRRLAEIDCPGGVCQRPDELPLWELGVLRGEYESAKSAIEGHHSWGEKMPDQKDTPAWKMRFDFLEKRERILKRAVEEAQLEADRMCPGKELKPSATEMHRKAEREAREEPNAVIRDQGEWIGQAVKEIEELREWMKQLPDEGAERTRAEVEHRIKETESGIEKSKRRIGLAKEMLETGVRPKGGLFWLR